jgi:MFS family permease
MDPPRSQQLTETVRHSGVQPPSISTRTALRFVVLLGIVSLFADMTYEGGRSITGPYLAHLGATATVVGIVAGFGELLGYGLRLASGYLSDRTGKYWAVTLAGYGLNLLAVPALALAGRWETAVALMMLERTGKAIRTPARDAMLAHATHEMGRGWGFGLHEAMDQTGALIGPLIVALVLHRTGHYPIAFAVLLVPAMLSLTVLLTARHMYPRPRDLEVSVPHVESRGIEGVFWPYLAAAGLIAAGYADFPLLAYHFAKTAVFPAPWIPVLYAVAMGSAAASALIGGRLFDRFGIVVLAASAVLSALFAPLGFLGGPRFAVAGVVLWGVGMGIQESAARAAVALMVPPARRAGAYGVFDTGFGVAWFLGSAVMGILYDRSVEALVAFSVVAQVSAIPVLLMVARKAKRASV